MCRMELQSINSDSRCSLCGINERYSYSSQASFIQFERKRLALIVGR